MSPGVAIFQQPDAAAAAETCKVYISSSSSSSSSIAGCKRFCHAPVPAICCSITSSVVVMVPGRVSVMLQAATSSHCSQGCSLLPAAAPLQDHLSTQVQQLESHQAELASQLEVTVATNKQLVAQVAALSKDKHAQV